MKADADRLRPYIGQEVWIDKGATNEGAVILLEILGDHFCIVKDPDTGAEWQTMMVRLSIFNKGY
jgi:hypothetical protein